MKALAAFIMASRGRAVMVASVAVVLGVLITPFWILGAAVLALVTLRRGWREAVLVLGFGLLALIGLGGLLFAQPLALASIGVLLWLPAILIAEVLRLTRSLRLAIEACVLLGVLLVGGQYMVLDDTRAFWLGILHEYSQQLLNPQVFSEAERQRMVEEMAPWMPGGMGAAWFLQLALTLFLARGWQALLYNPGGFAREIRELRLGKWLLIGLPALLLLGAVGESANLAAQCALVGMSAFFIQGIALAHGLVFVLKGGSGWLIGFYLLLIIGMPVSFTLVSALGFADGWLNFRAKARALAAKGSD